MTEYEETISLIIAHAICRPRPEPTREPYGFYPVEDHAIGNADSIMGALKQEGHVITPIWPTETQIEAILSKCATEVLAANTMRASNGNSPRDYEEFNANMVIILHNTKAALTAGNGK